MGFQLLCHLGKEKKKHFNQIFDGGDIWNFGHKWFPLNCIFFQSQNQNKLHSQIVLDLAQICKKVWNVNPSLGPTPAAALDLGQNSCRDLEQSSGGMWPSIFNWWEKLSYESFMEFEQQMTIFLGFW